jgi:hypothetical protein
VGLMASQTLGRRGDDDAVGQGMAWVNDIAGSGMALGAQCCGLGEDDVVVGLGMVSWAWGRCLCGQWRHRLMSGKIAARKGARPWLGTTVRRLRGGLDSSTGSGEVDDGASSREFLTGNFGSLTA